MKIAILGKGEMAIELASFFLEQDISVKVWGEGPLGGQWALLAKAFPGQDFFLDKGGGSQKSARKNDFSLMESLEKREKLFSSQKVRRVQKQFLYPGERIEGRSRLYDLFCVVYEVGPSLSLESSDSSNDFSRGEEKWGGDLVESLKSPLESFESFDLIIDARGPFQTPRRLGPGYAYALNEEFLSQRGFISYGYDFFEKILEKSYLDEKDTLTLVGDSEVSVLILLYLKEWISQKGKTLHIVVHGDFAFENFLKDPRFDSWPKDELKAIIGSHLKSWRQECEEVEKKLLEWRGLPEKERRRLSAPEFPLPKIQLYEGRTVVSVDKLMDRKSPLLTIEIPPWRRKEEGGASQKKLLTLETDHIIGAYGYEKDDSLFSSLDREEPGFIQGDSLEEVKEKVFHYFSRVKE